MLPLYKNKLTVIFISAFVTILSACSENNPVSHVFDTFKFALQGSKDFEVTRAKVDSIPYASIAAKIGKGPRSMLVLGRAENQDLHWISADRSAFVTRNGRVIETAGLPQKNLAETRFVGKDNMALHNFGDPVPPQLNLKLDIKPGGPYGMDVVCNYEIGDRIEIEIVEIKIDTYKITEHCRAEQIGWNFENIFFKSTKTGKVWKSKQYFLPDVPPIEIEILKPFSG